MKGNFSWKKNNRRFMKLSPLIFAYVHTLTFTCAYISVFRGDNKKKRGKICIASLLGAGILPKALHGISELPNLPKSPSPHVYSSPSSVTAALCLYPADTHTTTYVTYKKKKKCFHTNCIRILKAYASLF